MLTVVFFSVSHETVTFDDVIYNVILRNVGGLLADVIPLNLTDRCSTAKGGGREAVRKGWRGREPERSRVTG